MAKLEQQITATLAQLAAQRQAKAERVWPRDLPNDAPTWLLDPVRRGQRLVVVFRQGAKVYRIQSSVQDRSHAGAAEDRLVFAMRDALMRMLNGKPTDLVLVSRGLWQLP